MQERIAIIFDFAEQFSGNGFFGRVQVAGRGLLENWGEEGWVLHGVEPGGVGGVGDTQLEAVSDFLENFRGVLYDFAAEAATPEEFRELTMGFSASDHLVEQWEEARRELRARRRPRSIDPRSTRR